MAAADGLSDADRLALRRRLEAWLEATIAAVLGPLMRCQVSTDDAAFSAHGRAVLHHLVEGLGLVPRAAVAAHLDALAPAARKRLVPLGVRIGRTAVFIPALRGRLSLHTRIALAYLFAKDRVETRTALEKALRKIPIATMAPHNIAASRFHAAGYLLLGGCAVRIDAAERLAAATVTLARQGPFVPTAALAQSTGIPSSLLPAALTGLGFTVAKNGADASKDAKTFVRSKNRSHRSPLRAKPRPDSPFAALADLVRRP